MSATIIDGKAIATATQAEIKTQVMQLIERGVRPGLAVILVGENPASQVYVRNKVKGCENVGMHSVLDRYPADLSEVKLLARIEELNADPNIHGILVQLPLPKHINEHAVLEAIAPEKDVDGFHLMNAGALMTGQPRLRACTPYGVMKMLEYHKISPWGANAVVIGASNIVGKPMAMMLLQAGATVTICNSKTRDLASHTRNADIIVVAVGREKVLTGDMVRPGATVIDVGMNRNAEGKLCGDVDFESVKKVAGAITPVPGGVGPMTITMLLMNTLESAQNTLKSVY
ncbi:MAG: bifunctional methylenetetrahydrofolate dehydrogenase/methenyltetrahydrofolate cyclohydrolase FolD [Burkholderiales bacterium]|jgi:methylenetetrahydrofolate dehydrogenase (NADP+)/methenyltetrahydrofolate cyclohydrolase|nr:bifunctional methylenetetrahydrofolate dehydrogenase/methenyltetrahydrofolate cyclohydrolase FolD [Burkholderiales bacterium]MCE1177094.1 bifunctional methylenetetrahydrofolate dehydrogenase/methenyltetrahydrofolate cyclohydrolase FolD [Burkholderiales bacterium]